MKLQGDDGDTSPEVLLDGEGAYRAALARAAMASERRRTAVVAAFVAVCLAAYLVTLAPASPLPGWMRERLVRQAPLVVGLYAAVIAYELAARAWVGRRLRSGRPLPAAARYANAALEVTAPTVLILGAAAVFDPVESLYTPPTILYLVLIVLMTLQLDWRLCAFAGALAGAQYLAVAAALLPARPAGDGAGSIIADPAHHVLRAGMIVLCGMAAAFVARQLRGQFEQSARAVEERNRAVGIFGQHVSPQVAGWLLSQPLGHGPQVREVCVMFLDIRGFTAFAERRGPEEVMGFLNELFGPMIGTVNRHGGIINKFLGDGFMAVFGAPVPDGGAARHAVKAAMELVAQVTAGGAAVAPGGAPATRIGIGLHTGPAVTGNVGSKGRKEYTVIGGVVNLASRIEQLNKQFDSQVLASDAVFAALPPQERAAAQALGDVPVRGQSAPVTLYRLA
jgi:adenylate cyclase